MKIVSSVQGMVGMSASVDEVSPEKGLSMRDIIEVLSEEFSFNAIPQIPPGVAQLGPISFQAGSLLDDHEEKIVINSITLAGTVSIAIARTTEYAEIVLDRFAGVMDSRLGYKFSSTKKTYAYQSSVVVEFENGLERIITGLEKFKAAINKEINGSQPLQIKRLAWGHEEPITANPFSLEALERADFLIERRVNEPYSANRFMCQASMKTADHIEALRRIENSLKD